MPSIYEDRFWQEMDSAMWDEVAEIMIVTLLAGVEGGTNLLPANVQQTVDYDYINKYVMEFAKTYRYTWIKGITDVTRESTQKAIADWLQSGSPLPALEAALTPIYGQSRAERIAITETTRVIAEGNQQAWQSTGLVEDVQWMTANDEKVCPICGELDGQTFPLNDISPPAHPQCRCWVQPILSEAAFSKALDEVLG